MPSYDPSKVYYITSATVDKILTEGTFSHTEGSGTPGTPSFSTAGTPNTLGIPAWIEGQYSIDGSNYYPLGTRIDGALSGTDRQYVYCYGYADAANLHFYVENGFTSNKTFDIRYALESLT